MRAALRKMGGQYMTVITRYDISLSEAVDFAAQDAVTMRRVHERECPGLDRACVLQVNLAAREIAINAEIQSTRSISGLRSVTVHRDAGLAANGLERFTGNAGGSLITVHAGPDQALKRLLQETSAYYLLGVETAPADRDGRTHRIQAKVKQGGTTVRSRSAVFIPRAQ